MGMPKAIRKLAITAERVATQAADTFVADQMKTQRIKGWLNIYPDLTASNCTRRGTMPILKH
jgi:hypothetical protein